MSWTERSDAESCCNGTLGAVSSAETIARFLHSGNCHNGQLPFRISELAHRTSRPFSNQCGDADGASVDRRLHLSDDELRRRSQKQADVANLRRLDKPPHTAQGAVVASVAQLRKFRLQKFNGQVIFVYDDPKPDDDEHAVIRCVQLGDRPSEQLVLDVIVQAFTATRVEQV